MRRALVWIGVLASTGAPFAASADGTLFLDRCSAGCAYTPGFDDAGSNTSSVVSQASNLAAFAHGDTSWNAVVDCVRDTFAPFDIEVTDADPGTAPHFEIAVAGLPTQIGFPNGVANVASVTCADDRVVEDGIGFAFANLLGDVPLEICWNAAQAAGSLLGLDIALLATDVMTYLNGPLPKAFEDQAASCGESQARPCRCGGTTQNSYQWLVATLPEPGAAMGAAAALAALAGVRRRTRR
jgi:hypothetical protein